MLIVEHQIPGATITAKGTNQHMQAHGGGIIEVDNVFYLIGENKFNGSAFQSLNCYSSPVSILSYRFSCSFSLLSHLKSSNQFQLFPHPLALSSHDLKPMGGALDKSRLIAIANRIS